MLEDCNPKESGLARLFFQTLNVLKECDLNGKVRQDYVKSQIEAMRKYKNVDESAEFEEFESLMLELSYQ